MQPIQNRPTFRRSIVTSVMLIFLSVAVLPLYAQLIVSELYRDPPGTESSLGGGGSHEFVEITNLGPDSVSLDSLFITNGIEADSVVPVGVLFPGHEHCIYNAHLIAPGATALLLDPDYRKAIAEDSTRRFSLPAATILLKCGDSEFGNNGLAANDGVIIYRGIKSRIDTILCSAVDPGTLLQKPTAGKTVLSNPENREGYSLVSIAVLSALQLFDYCPARLSPGWYEPLKNGWLLEWRLGNYDSTTKAVPCTLAALGVEQPFAGPLGWLLETIRNGKLLTVESGSITLSGNRGSAPLSIPVDSTEMHLVLAVDSRPAWSIDLSTVWRPATAIRITEIFPKATTGEPEWFEITNITGMPIDLINWRFGNSEDTVVLTEVHCKIGPGAFAVITKDSTVLASRYRGQQHLMEPHLWHTLDNTRDTIMLLDAAGTVQERICYDDQWFASWPYLSLERNGNASGCSKECWSVAARATPGQPNNALFWRSTDQPSLDIGPIPFTPDNDGTNDLLAIRLSLPAAASVTIDIYGFNGRIIKRFSGMPQEVYYWDGRGSGGAAPPGPFFVVAEITRGYKIQRIRKKGVLWRK